MRGNRQPDDTGPKGVVPFRDAHCGPVDLPPLGTPNGQELVQDHWRAVLAQELYGAMPAPPSRVETERIPLPDKGVEHLLLHVSVADRTCTVDAALWLPREGNRPAPLICGLDFVGPAGILTGDSFPLDPHAIIFARSDSGDGTGRLDDTHRGASAGRWPVAMLCDSGFAVLVSCYGSWVPDHPDGWRCHGVHPLLDLKATGEPVGAIGLWAWSLLRMIDAATERPEVDTERMVVAGHSRLGKAALWATANDARIRAVFANGSGCAGAAPARHPVGETLDQLRAQFPHWLIPNEPVPDPGVLPYDQHALIALAAPRAVYVGGAEEDLWADPVGSYLALTEASRLWPSEAVDRDAWPPGREMWCPGRQIINGPLGCHLRPGGHDLTHVDWKHFLGFCSSNRIGTAL